MSAQLLVLLLTLEMEDENLIAASIAQDLPNDASVGSGISAQAIIAAHGEHVAELECIALGRKLLNVDDVPGRDAILLSPGADDRVHSNASS
jgi:hypothetical protein